MENLWKKNFDETKRHFQRWWKHEGMVLVLRGKYNQFPSGHVQSDDPGPAASPEKWTNATWRARLVRHQLAHQSYPADNLPIAITSIGPGSLALYLGSEPTLQERTVWYNPCISDPDKHPPLVFSPENKWWKIHCEIIDAMRSLSNGNYFIGCPDLIENIDILASLRDSQTLLIDMIERPSWIKEKLLEINRAYFDAYDRIYEKIKLPDGSSIFSHFDIWGPGKTLKVQCDASAMFSPDMFTEFVVPALTQQCAWADYTLYHLDGPGAVCHAPALAAIKELDAIQWVPGAGQLGCDNKHWFGLYKLILAAGKSLQINVPKTSVKKILDTIGGKGLYLMVSDVNTEADAEEMYRLTESYR